MAKVHREKHNGGLDALKLAVADLGDRSLQTGWFESAKYDEGTPVAGVAAVQEFGTASGGIPPRPFIRPAIDDGKEGWIKFIGKGSKQVLVGDADMVDVLDRLGLVVAGEIRKNISTLTEPALSPITLALRKQKLQGKKISGSVVGATAAAIARGETGAGELGDSSGVNPKPLVFDGIMLATLTHEAK